jgi:hypothetical protein
MAGRARIARSYAARCLWPVVRVPTHAGAPPASTRAIVKSLTIASFALYRPSTADVQQYLHHRPEAPCHEELSSDISLLVLTGVTGDAIAGFSLHMKRAVQILSLTAHGEGLHVGFLGEEEDEIDIAVERAVGRGD